MKIKFFFGAIGAGECCFDVMNHYGMFSTLPMAIFSVVFIVAIAICGGLTMWLLSDAVRYFKERKYSVKRKKYA